jgi:hypothetical protein
MRATGWTRGVLALGLGGLLIAGCAAGAFTKDETPGQHFERQMKEFAENCAKAKLRPNDRSCDRLKLKPADPLATEEGRFAHSIKIPNPVPEDSGYRPGMTPEQYFDHLCKTEAGEFVYKTVENIDGVLQMRPQKKASDYEVRHLYALEDPNIIHDGEDYEPAFNYVVPQGYQFFEAPFSGQVQPSWKKEYRHSSFSAVPGPDSKYERYSGYDGRDMKMMRKEYVKDLKSQYGYTWRGIKRPHDRELGVAGGELIVLNLQTNEVLAVRRRYIRAVVLDHPDAGIAWGRVCYPERGAKSIQPLGFVRQVLKPLSAGERGGDNATK